MSNADSKSSTADAGPKLTAGESKFLAVMFQNMTDKPPADWDNVASELSLKDAKCAKERFRQIGKRHGWLGATGSADTTPTKAKASPRKASGGVAEGKVKKETATPRKGRGKGKVVKSEETVREEDVKDEVEDDGLSLPHEMPGMDDDF